MPLNSAQAKFALTTLAEYYKENNDERVYGVWERILKVDYEEADIAKLLAERYEKEGDIENTISYYKKAMYRYDRSHDWEEQKNCTFAQVLYLPIEKRQKTKKKY